MWPSVIQGGMGVGVSGWALARAVACCGQLGVVSGTALDPILIRRLQDGDSGGHMRRALAAFPLQGIVRRVLDRYFRPEGCPPPDDKTARYRNMELLRAPLTPDREAIMVLANFAEVYLAKAGHAGMVGINYLEKMQMATLPSLYGAILAGVDVVLMGAGIPIEIPEAIDRFLHHEPAAISFDVLDRGDAHFQLHFDPCAMWSAEGLEPPALKRPLFFPIVSSVTLSRALLKRIPKDRIDGFVVEGPVAGGHNAPPRGEIKRSPRGEPIYGERDSVDATQMAALGLPFWLAGGQGTPAKFAAAVACGAKGIQVGTAFACCEESGISTELKQRLLAAVLAGQVEVFTDPLISPTGFPFKVVTLEGTLSQAPEYAARPRICDLGYLRRAYRKADGMLGFRCAAEPVEDYVRKGGKAEDTIGRKCLCNGLVANIGLRQRRADGYEELPIVTAGDDLECLKQFITPQRLSYRAKDVIDVLLGAA